MRSLGLAGFVALVVLSVSVVVLAYPCGNFPDHTGRDPGQTCQVCHYNPATGPGRVVIDTGGVGTYDPGSFIPIRVALENPQNAAGNGFQMVADDPGVGPLKEWIFSDRPNVWMNPHGIVAHTMQGTRKSEWMTYLQAPPLSQGFTVYVASLDGNDSASELGDFTYTAQLDMKPGVVPLSLMAPPKIGTTVALKLNSPVDAGRPYAMAASLGNSGIDLGDRKLPLSPDPLFFFTAENLAPEVFVNYRGTLNQSGVATAALSVPNLPALEGVILYHAFVTLDLAGPRGIGRISNALPVMLYTKSPWW